MLVRRGCLASSPGWSVHSPCWIYRAAHTGRPPELSHGPLPLLPACPKVQRPQALTLTQPPSTPSQLLLPAVETGVRAGRGEAGLRAGGLLPRSPLLALRPRGWPLRGREGLAGGAPGRGIFVAGNYGNTAGFPSSSRGLALTDLGSYSVASALPSLSYLGPSLPPPTPTVPVFFLSVCS